ncbi:MAG: cell envelope integrity protein TolA [Kiritimatiellia bacterium]
MNRKRIFFGSVLTHAVLIGVISIGASLQGCNLLRNKDELTVVSLMGTDDPALGTLDGGKAVAAPAPPAEPDPPAAAEPAPPEPEVAKEDPEAIREPETPKEKPKEKPKPEVVKAPDPPKEKPKPEIVKGKPVVREVAKVEKPKEPAKPKVDPRLEKMKFVDAKELGAGSKMTNPNARNAGIFGDATGREGGTGPRGNGGASLAVDQYIYEAMYAAWDQPKSVPGGTRAKVSGTLNRNGLVTNVAMLLPSGDAEFDQSVIGAARRVTRINFPPALMTGSTFDFVVVYEMKGSPLGTLGGY